MLVADGSRPYIVAEIGANHNGDMELARTMIRAAAGAGCNCVKFQSFDERLFAREVYERSRFLDDGRDVARDLRAAVRAYSLSAAQIAELCQFAHGIGVDCASSVFEPDHVAALIDARADFIKIASMDVDNPALLRAAAAAHVPIVLSTGMATMEEIAEAVSVLESTGTRELVLMHCVSLYPPPDEAINLNNIDMLRDAFGYPVGFSDHTTGTAVPLGAVAKGAVMIEKHFTTDKHLEGWDHGMSADPAEMQSLVADARRIHAALGQRRRYLTEAERAKRAVMRRSLVAARPIASGHTITAQDLTSRRPGTGLSPRMADVVIGMKAVRDIDADTVLRLDDLCGA